MLAAHFRPYRVLPIAAFALLAACGRSSPPGSDDGGSGGDAGASLDGAADVSGFGVGDANPDPSPSSAGKSDGVCEPVDPRFASFDPDCVYALGSGRAAGQSYGGILHPSLPTNVAVGFGDTYFEAAKIRPTDGSLAFIGTGGPEFGKVRLFFFRKSIGSTDPFPLLSQEVVPTPGCEANDLRRVSFFPDDGELAYECIQAPPRWYVGSSTTPLDTRGWPPIAFGTDRTLLVGSGSPGQNIIDLAVLRKGVVTRVSGIERISGIEAVRAIREGGFRVVVHLFDSASPPVLYEVYPDATATYVGTFREPAELAFGACGLAPDGTMECTAHDRKPDFRRDLYRVSLDADPVLLSQSTVIDPRFMVTGP